MRVAHSRWFALLPLLVVVAIVIAACGGGDEEEPTRAPQPTTPPATTPTPTAAPTVPPTPTPILPKRGGILRTRITFSPTAPSHWDLLRGPINSGFPLFQPVLSSLVQLDQETQKVVGDLAQSWEFSPDGKQVTFKLRPGVTWHDGTALKASDIKSNWDVILKETLGFKSHFQSLVSAADGTEALDDATFRIILKRPSNSFFRTLAHGLMVNYQPAVSRDELQKGKVVGTNAFVWTKSDLTKIEERRYPNYWDKGADGKPLPYLDGIDWNVIADRTLHNAAFRTGQIDAIDHIDSPTLDDVANIKKDIPNLVVGSASDSWRMVLIKNRAPWTNIAVRKALQIASDRQVFVDAALKGSATPAGYVMSPKGFGGAWGPTLDEQQKLPGINPRTRQQDLVEAERLMASAGFSAASPLKVTIHVVGSGTFPDEAVVWASQTTKDLKSIQIEVKAEEAAIHNRRLVVPGGDFDMIYRPFAQAFDDPSQTVGLFWTSTASRNYGEWKDAQIDAWYDEQETTTNSARRAELMNQIQQRLYDQSYNLVLGWAATAWVKRPDVKGLFLGGAFSNRGRYDKTWFDR